MAGRPLNPDLEVARLMGDKTYEGSVHTKCGTTTRYTSTGSCVFCAVDKQQNQRRILKRLTENDAAATEERDILD